VFGGTNPGGTIGGPGRPTAEHWRGRRWRAVPLPARLAGFIIAASAPAPHSVWVVSYSGSYVLHWTGRAWTVAKRWRHPSVATSITAVNAADVWVFSGGGSLGTWHFNGRRWVKAGGAAGWVYRASALGRGDIWAITLRSKAGSVVRYNGRNWRAVRTGSALSGVRPTDILAVSRDDVWISGTSGSRLVVAHWDGGRWSRFVAPWRLLPERFTTDGRGGLWIPTAGGTLSSWIVHLSPHGRWARTRVSAGRFGTGIGDLARIPGTRTVWGSGGFLTSAGGDAAIWAHGRVPARSGAPIRQATSAHGGTAQRGGGPRPD
jgi:hypothetical protein